LIEICIRGDKDLKNNDSIICVVARSKPRKCSKFNDFLAISKKTIFPPLTDNPHAIKRYCRAISAKIPISDKRDTGFRIILGGWE